jgi:hypothetical protein
VRKGWYIEVPDEDVPFSLHWTVLALGYPLSTVLFVDGQKASARTSSLMLIELSTSITIFTKLRHTV